MLLGYARLSKADGQVLDLQRDALAAAGVRIKQIYDDKASGSREDRPGLEAFLKALRKGDTLVVWKLDRLGRDLRHLVNLVHDLTSREVGLMGQTRAPDRKPAYVRSWRLSDLPGPAIAKQHSGASFVRLDRTGGK